MNILQKCFKVNAFMSNFLEKITEVTVVNCFKPRFVCMGKYMYNNQWVKENLRS